MMNQQKSRFALFFGNRGFFPASLIASARRRCAALRGLGHDVLMLDAEATRYGAVETPHEGEVLRQLPAPTPRQVRRRDPLPAQLRRRDRRGGRAAGRRRADLIQAYPDEFDKMAPGAAARLVLRQDLDHGRLPPVRGQVHSARNRTRFAPAPTRFKANIDEFDRVCRVVQRHQGHGGRRHRRAHHAVQDRAHRRGGPAAPRHHGRDLRSVGRLRPHAQR